DHVLREGTWPRDREIEVIDDIGNVVAEVTGRDVDGVQPRARLVDRRLRERTLVIAGKLGEAAVKTVGDAALALAGENRDQARIYAARHIGPDRNVAAQMHCNRIVEQFDNAALEIACIVLEIDLVAHIPIAPHSDLAILDNQRMAGQQLLDAAKQSGLT